MLYMVVTLGYFFEMPYGVCVFAMACDIFLLWVFHLKVRD